jgi:arylsulfatase A-like enzyme
LPAILADALSPFTLRHIVVAPPLQNLFGLTVVVGMCATLITAVFAILVSLLRFGPAGTLPASSPLFVPAAGFFVAALLFAPALHSHATVSKLPLATAVILVTLLGCCAAATLTYASVFAFTRLGARNPVRAGAWLSLVVWFVAVVQRFSIGLVDPRLGVLLCAMLAGIAMSDEHRVAQHPHKTFCLAFIAAIAVTILTPIVAFRGTRLRASEGVRASAAWNVLIVLVDTLRADSITPGGAPPSASPFLSELVARPRSTYFANAGAAAPSTVPSVKALFTGQRPSAWGTSATNEPPPAQATTLPAAFARAGFETALVSANPLIDCERFGAGTDWCWSAGGYRYFLRSFLLNNLWTANRVWEGFERVDRLHVHNIDGAIVLELTKKWLDSRPKLAPFFAYVHLIDPHWPYYTNAVNNPPPATGEHSYVPFLRLNQGGSENASLRTGPALAALRERYARQVRHVDSLLHGFMGFVETRDLRSNTLVIVVGDHGEEFLEHNGFGHGHDVFEEQTHVPLLILWPDDPAFSNAPRRVEEPVSLVDIVPTLEDLFGVQVTPRDAAAGTSLLPMIDADLRTRQSPIVSEAFAPGRSYLSYREGERKLRIRFDETMPPATSPHVLAFDLAGDPGESSPVRAENPSVRDLVERARAHLSATHAASPR